jgi:hypothetical protein
MSASQQDRLAVGRNITSRKLVVVETCLQSQCLSTVVSSNSISYLSRHVTMTRRTNTFMGISEDCDCKSRSAEADWHCVLALKEVGTVALLLNDTFALGNVAWHDRRCWKRRYWKRPGLPHQAETSRGLFMRCITIFKISARVGDAPAFENTGIALSPL